MIQSMSKNLHQTQQEALARRGEALMATHLAVLECYAARVDLFRARLEKTGYTKEHPIVDALAKHAAAARMDVPKLEIPPLELPELPKFDFKAPPAP